MEGNQAANKDSSVRSSTICTEHRKFKTTPYISPESYDSHLPINNITLRTSRCFDHWHHEAQDQNITNARNDEPGNNASDLKPTNLLSTALMNAESTLLTKGPAFCQTPKDVHWKKVIDDLDNFDKHIGLDTFHHDKNKLDNN